MSIINIFVLLLIVVTTASSQFAQSKIACEGKSITLKCNKGEYLTVIGGNWGRTNAEVCKKDKNNNCKSPNSINIMRKKCNDQQTCTLKATNNDFGDPCPYNIKYLEVIYICTTEVQCNSGEFKCADKNCISNSKVCDGYKDCSGGEDENGCTYPTAYGCETEGLQVECKEGEIIRVISGEYGRTNPSTCKFDNTNINCRSTQADNILKQRCNFQRICKIADASKVFVDPCPGVSKYIEMEYTCWKVPEHLKQFYFH